MKQFLLLFVALIIVGESIAQITYESPHVKDGKTLQLTIPSGYFETSDLGDFGMSIYSTNKDLDVDGNEAEVLKAGIIILMHMPKAGEGLNSMKDMIEQKMEGEDATVIQKPEIVDLNGLKCLNAGFNGKVVNDLDGTTYFSVIEFGDYFLLLTHYASTLSENHLEFSTFEGIMASWKEVATTKKDGLEDLMEEEYSAYEDEEEYEDYSVYFKNDLFETQLEYYDVLPDFEGEWDEYRDESGHLLSMFSYKEENGSIKIFSVGSASNYPSEEEMANAIQLAMDYTKPIELAHNSRFSNEDHVFQLYTISGGGTMSSVYTTEVGGELVFFVVDEGSSPADDFKPAVRDFMLTMWVDYIEEE